MGFKRISIHDTSINYNIAVGKEYTLKFNYQSAIVTCDICGFQFTDVHCKLKCTKCGYMRDCSDP